MANTQHIRQQKASKTCDFSDVFLFGTPKIISLARAKYFCVFVCVWINYAPLVLLVMTIRYTRRATKQLDTTERQKQIDKQSERERAKRKKSNNSNTTAQMKMKTITNTQNSTHYKAIIFILYLPSYQFACLCCCCYWCWRRRWQQRQWVF